MRHKAKLHPALWLRALFFFFSFLLPCFIASSGCLFNLMHQAEHLTSLADASAVGESSTRRGAGLQDVTLCPSADFLR